MRYIFLTLFSYHLTRRLVPDQRRPDASSECSNGLPGYEGTNENGSACCPLGCTACGGLGCSKVGAAAGFDNTACCINGVLNNQPDCSVSGAAPCRVDSDGELRAPPAKHPHSALFGRTHRLEHVQSEIDGAHPPSASVKRRWRISGLSPIDLSRVL